MLFYLFFIFLSFRNGEPRSAWAGGPGLPHALSPGLPRVTPRDDEAVLEEGRGREAHLRVHPVLLRRLLHFHGAAVPARGQPLDWPLGEEGVGGGRWCGFEVHGWTLRLGAVGDLEQMGWSFDEAAQKERGIDLTNFSTTTQVQKEKKCNVFRCRGLSLEYQGTKCWMEESRRPALPTTTTTHTDWPQHCDQRESEALSFSLLLFSN